MRPVSDRFVVTTPRHGEPDAAVRSCGLVGLVGAGHLRRFEEVGRRFGQMDARFGRLETGLVAVHTSIDALHHVQSTFLRQLTLALFVSLVSILVAAVGLR